jgi:hypothetical protein
MQMPGCRQEQAVETRSRRPSGLPDKLKESEEIFSHARKAAADRRLEPKTRKGRSMGPIS